MVTTETGWNSTGCRRRLCFRRLWPWPLSFWITQEPNQYLSLPRYICNLILVKLSPLIRKILFLPMDSSEPSIGREYILKWCRLYTWQFFVAFVQFMISICLVLWKCVYYFLLSTNNVVWQCLWRRRCLCLSCFGSNLWMAWPRNFSFSTLLHLWCAIEAFIRAQLGWVGHVHRMLIGGILNNNNNNNNSVLLHDSFPDNTPDQ